MALSDWLALARFEHGVMTLVGVLLGALMAGGSADLRLVAAALGPAIITLAAFISNDCFDVATDKALGRTDRPLVSGRVSLRNAHLASVAFFAVGLALAFYAGFALFVIAFAYSLAAVAYNAFLKRLPLVGNLYVASSMAVPFVYGAVAAAGVRGVPYLVWVFALLAFVAGVGRELLITTRDVEGDRHVGALTLPMVLGAYFTLALSLVLFIVAVFVSFLPLAQNSSMSYAVLVGACDAILLYSGVSALNDPSFKNLSRLRNYSLAALLLGLAGFAALTLL
ncbi:hypothetical protein AUJ14_00930 [Candidatus Micrarchaeota archaeon CG1_02_55_22]|nr:MAG: hypothetical protein AUJ14_00930 [Candidatus Micrarchaeota archaeon CG1_02_55_22]